MTGGGIPAPAQEQRVLGLDVSAWQGNISQLTWNNVRNVEDRRFVFIRSTRGGTTGIDKRQGGFPSGDNTTYNYSQRYDDLYFVQNINRVTTAGMYAGPYHFGRPDILASTLNSDGTTAGVANNGTDEANHFIQMAGAWMRPGFLVPVFDLEAGSDAAHLAPFAIDFSERIYQVMRIRPAMYINGNYLNILQNASVSLRDQLAKPPTLSPSVVSPAYSILWPARYANQSDPDSIPVQTGNPKNTPTTLTAYYGPWDDYGNAQPWSFWQYASTVRLQSFNSGNNNLDGNVAQGGDEFVKDHLVPAVWMHDLSGDWSTLTNWNSGQTPLAPTPGPGQMTPVGTQTLPVARLPGAAGSGVTSGQHDTVILERPNANITVTLSTGAHNIRKLYIRETLNLTGGSLNVNYVPSWDSTTNGAQFSGPVTLSGSGNLTVHTLQVDTNQTFTLAGGTFTFHTLNLMPHASAPARLLVSGNATLNARSNVTAVIARGAGSGNSGFVDLGGGTRILSVGNGTNEVDMLVNVPILNGAFAKAGAGTMRLTSTNIYSGGTTVSAGRLLVNNTAGSGTGSGSVTVNGGVLGGTGRIAGAVLVNAAGTIAPGTESAMGTLILSNALTLNGINVMRINRNHGSPLTDKIIASGPLNYGGSLVVTNVGAAPVGGDVFTLYSAGAYAGGFATTILPELNPGLNWYLGRLVTNGTLVVNRSPLIGPALTFTNYAPAVLQIPFAAFTANATDADGDPVSLAGINPMTASGVTLTTDGFSIFYSNHLSVTDQISYVVSDGRGGSATGAVHVVNVGSSPAAALAAAPMVSGTAVYMQFSATPGWTYHVERSTNLPHWTTIWTTNAPVGGLFEFTDHFGDLAAPPLRAFYRLRWTP